MRPCSSEIEALDSNDPLLAGRKIQQLQSALKEVEQFHQIDTNTRWDYTDCSDIRFCDHLQPCSIATCNSATLVFPIDSVSRQSTSVKNYLSETCEYLKQMLRTVNVREETTSALAKIRQGPVFASLTSFTLFKSHRSLHCRRHRPLTPPTATLDTPSKSSTIFSKLSTRKSSTTPFPSCCFAPLFSK